VNNLKITKSAAFLAITIIIQTIGLPQIFTGPLVNAVLVTAGFILGPVPAVIIGFITPFAAFIRGILPGILGPMVPFIAIGNSVYILVFVMGFKHFGNFNQQKDIFYMGITIISASLLKTIILFIAIIRVLPIFFGTFLPGSVVYIMTTPQFITGIAGGIISLFLIKFLVKSPSITSVF